MSNVPICWPSKTHKKLNFSRRHADTHWREHAADKVFQYSHMRRWSDQVNQYSKTSNLHMKLTHLKTIHGHNQMCKRRNRAAVTHGLRWDKTVLKLLSPCKNGQSWCKTVLYHLNPTLCFMRKVLPPRWWRFQICKKHKVFNDDALLIRFS